MEKKVIWSNQAKSDLQRIYDFNSPIIGEEKSFQLIHRIIEKADNLYYKIQGGTRYVSSISPHLNYQKLISGNFLIIYREDNTITYINRIFDGRQSPDKLKL